MNNTHTNIQVAVANTNLAASFLNNIMATFVFFILLKASGVMTTSWVETFVVAVLCEVFKWVVSSKS